MTTDLPPADHDDLRTRLSTVSQHMTDIAFLERLSQDIRLHQLVSDNEELDDINSEDLPAVLVDYWLGTCLLTTTERQTDVRTRVIHRAKAVLETFMMRCRLLGIASSSTTTNTMPSSREEKIARFKTQKALQDAIAHAEQQLTKSHGGGDISTHDDFRDLWILRIRLANEQVQDDIASAEKELSVLDFMMKSDPEHLKKVRDERVKEQQAPGTMDVTRLTQSLEVKREVFKDGVFRPYHNLPTMSLEEFAEKEMAQLKEREEKSKMAQSNAVLSLNELMEQGLEDESDKLDAATIKAGKWDDWKDGVPKGAGVTKRL